MLFTFHSPVLLSAAHCREGVRPAHKLSQAPRPSSGFQQVNSSNPSPSLLGYPQCSLTSALLVCYMAFNNPRKEESCFTLQQEGPFPDKVQVPLGQNSFKSGACERQVGYKYLEHSTILANLSGCFIWYDQGNNSSSSLDGGTTRPEDLTKP